MKRYDLVVIGSGAGLMVLEEALHHGLRCAIVERSKIGGTCLTKGCIPSKMLVFPADFIREAEMAERFGVNVQRPRIEWGTISQRMWEQINFSEEILQNLMQKTNFDVYRGGGSFMDPHTLAIHNKNESGKTDDVIQGERIVIAAGARSFVPEIDGLEEAGYITSEDFFGDKFPDKPWGHLAILGGGAISMEFAHIFSAYGAKVTVIERSGRILRKEEAEISAFMTREFVKNGVEILTDSKITAVRTEDGKKHVTVENKKGDNRAVVCDELLIASGIRSNADTLSMENAGIALDPYGWIPTNEFLETTRAHIFALGDINGKFQLRHKANYEAMILANNLFGGKEKKAADYSAVPWAIFTHPQVAHVGMTERELQEKGVAYRSAKNHYSEVVAGRAMGYRTGDGDDGFVKMLVGENSRILGVHIVGPQAAVLLQPFVYLMRAGGYAPILDSMVIHPSLSELTAWVFEKLDLTNGE